MPGKQQEDGEVSAPETPSDGTPVVIPHIDFTLPTGNPQVEVRKGYGLTPPVTSGTSTESGKTPDA